jgi:hypothetical protein
MRLRNKNNKIRTVASKQTQEDEFVDWKSSPSDAIRAHLTKNCKKSKLKLYSNKQGGNNGTTKTAFGG